MGLSGNLGEQPLDIDVDIAVLAHDSVFRHYEYAIGHFKGFIEFRQEKNCGAP
jgi:hypothetical protein